MVTSETARCAAFWLVAATSTIQALGRPTDWRHRTHGACPLRHAASWTEGARRSGNALRGRRQVGTA